MPRLLTEGVILNTIGLKFAEVAELADARDSKSRPDNPG